MNTVIIYGSCYGTTEVYAKLSFVHRTMMKLLYDQVKKKPLEEQDAETRAMVETYGRKVDFVDLGRLDELVNGWDKGDELNYV